jgi:DNA-binding NarL/FixJ family response regulator
VRVLVCDEFPLFRRQVVLALEQAPDIEVIGEAPDTDTARFVGQQIGPDVALLGTHLPPFGGVRTAAALRETLPNIEMALAIDPENERDARELGRAVRAGITGVMPRDAVAAHAVPVTRSLVHRRPVLDAPTAIVVLADYRQMAARADAQPEARPRPPTLEPRERQALEQLAGGATLTQAAANLDWPVVTTSNVVANALRKVHRYARLYAQVRAREAEAAPS